MGNDMLCWQDVQLLYICIDIHIFGITKYEVIEINL